MSTNKTPNYQLHSWLPTDDFRLHEVNENFTKLDTALKSEVQSLTAMINTRARLITGTYRGTGDTTTQHITVGIRPKAVLILTDEGVVLYKVTTNVAYGGMTVQGQTAKGAITLDNTGFTVAKASEGFTANGTLNYYYIVLY